MLQHVAECKLHVKRHVTARYVLQVGEEYQIEVEPGPSTITSEACRTRLDMLTWCPNRAAAEGIDVPCYLAGAARLNAVTREPLEFSPEAALRCATSNVCNVCNVCNGRDARAARVLAGGGAAVRYL